HCRNSFLIHAVLVTPSLTSNFSTFDHFSLLVFYRPIIMSAPKDLSLWNSKKEVLYDLFIRRNNKLKDVKTIMERDHEFPNSLKLSEYECVLRVFKFRKYLKADDWRLSVGPKIAKRQAKGKHSEVLLNGSKVQNIDRKIRRAHTGKRSHYQTGHNVELPHGVVIRTTSPQPSTPVLPAAPFHCGPGQPSSEPGVKKVENQSDRRPRVG
ncbi:hypothetical protein FJTKL_07393, partial [Diaporthe vaccinii]